MTLICFGEMYRNYLVHDAFLASLMNLLLLILTFHQILTVTQVLAESVLSVSLSVILLSSKPCLLVPRHDLCQSLFLEYQFLATEISFHKAFPNVGVIFLQLNNVSKVNCPHPSILYSVHADKILHQLLGCRYMK